MMIANEYFIFIDIFLIVLIALFVIVGCKKGFVYEIVSLICNIVSIFIAWFIAPVLAYEYPFIKLEVLSETAELVSKMMNLDIMLNICFYFLATYLLFKVILVVFSFILKSMNKLPIIGRFNKFFGGIVGLVNSFIVILALSMLLNLPIIKNGNEIKEQTLFKYVHETADKVMNVFIDNADLEAIKVKFKDLNIETARDDLKQWLEEQK